MQSKLKIPCKKHGATFFSECLKSIKGLWDLQIIAFIVNLYFIQRIKTYLQIKLEFQFQNFISIQFIYIAPTHNQTHHGSVQQRQAYPIACTVIQFSPNYCKKCKYLTYWTIKFTYTTQSNLINHIIPFSRKHGLFLFKYVELLSKTYKLHQMFLSKRFLPGWNKERGCLNWWSQFW